MESKQEDRTVRSGRSTHQQQPCAFPPRHYPSFSTLNAKGATHGGLIEAVAGKAVMESSPCLQNFRLSISILLHSACGMRRCVLAPCFDPSWGTEVESERLMKVLAALQRVPVDPPWAARVLPFNRARKIAGPPGSRRSGVNNNQIAITASGEGTYNLSSPRQQPPYNFSSSAFPE